MAGWCSRIQILALSFFGNSVGETPVCNSAYSSKSFFFVLRTARCRKVQGWSRSGKLNTGYSGTNMKDDLSVPCHFKLVLPGPLRVRVRTLDGVGRGRM